MVEERIASIDEPGDSALSDVSYDAGILFEIDGSCFPGDSRERGNRENAVKR
jgi:hypothetical protein